MAASTFSAISELVKANKSSIGTLTVALSNELVHLLSDQLYQSPSKAVEELVVNSFDADADTCRVYVPSSNDPLQIIAVWDDGIGMSLEGLTDLWHIGASPKKNIRTSDRHKRKQIGKFGIGKLATYTIANKLTYITKKNKEILSVTINYESFAKGSGKYTPVSLDVKKIKDIEAFLVAPEITLLFQELKLPPKSFIKKEHWTLAILEDLKAKSSKLKKGTLGNVLSTAMPLTSNFTLYLNGDEVRSSKTKLEKAISFSLADFPELRLNALSKRTGESWAIVNGSVVSDSFPAGISGSIFVSDKTLVGKSDDLFRSNGFFVRVRRRLINEQDPLFGLRGLSSYQTFNRFRAEIEADDLDSILTAPREGVEDSPLKSLFQGFLEEVYLEARHRYEDFLNQQNEKNTHKPETERNYVNYQLVEHPIADTLATSDTSLGGEADGKWFYIDLGEIGDVEQLVNKLYGERSQGRYSYAYSKSGPNERMVKFNPESSLFSINIDHDFVRAHFDDGRSRALLEDVVTAEALLEVYMRECGIQPSLIGDILERRDLLLKSLSEDHPYSLEFIAQKIRNSADDERELEINLVAAARALGFVATQVSNAGRPDGLARLTTFPDGEVVITLEAKSSASIPTLAAIDFAGIQEHLKRSQANGCLLLAPAYPGQTEEDNAAAFRAAELKISCWTVSLLAQVVENAESRHINAEDVLNIVRSYFKPADVEKAVNQLLANPIWVKGNLYTAILTALRQLQERLKDRRRSVDMVATEVSRNDEFSSVSTFDVDAACKDLAGASQGGLIYRDSHLVITVSLDELDRRLRGLTGEPGRPRKAGSFKSIG